MPRRCLHGSANIAEGCKYILTLKPNPELRLSWAHRPTVCQQLLVPTGGAYGINDLHMKFVKA